MKKLIAICLAFALLCSMLVGCSKSDKNKLVDTNKLTLYVEDRLLDTLEDTLEIYGDKYPDVKIEFVDLREEDETKMRTDMLAGKGPDIIFDGFNVDNLYKSVQAGLFCDLDELIKQDKDFKLSDYNEKVMNAGVFNGKRYLLPLTYSVPNLLTTQSILDETGMNLKESNNYIELYREIDKYLNKGNIKTHVFSDALETGNLFRCYGDVFVDYEKGTVNLDSTQLKETLSMYKDFLNIEIGDKPSPENLIYYTNQGYYHLKDKAKAFETHILSNQSIFDDASKLIAAGEKPVIIPIRGFDGKIQATPSLSAGVRANSENKKNAFNFIKIMLSNTIQEKSILSGGMPVRNDSLDVVFNRIERESANSTSGVPQSQLPTEYFNDFKKVLNEMESCRFLDDYSYAYVRRYMKPYFDGEKSYEECLKTAKSAFEIYVSE